MIPSGIPRWTLGAALLLTLLILPLAAKAGEHIGTAPSGTGGYIGSVPLGAGDLDPTFGSGGVATTWFPAAANSQAYAMAIQPDGKRVLGGTIDGPPDLSGSPPPLPNSDFALARYNTDGTLDTTFGNGGFVTTNFLGYADYLRAVAVQADGKIVAAGTASRHGYGGDWVLVVVRYNPNGSLDSSFGSGGKLVVYDGYGSLGFALQIQPDGKILIGGNFYDGQSYFFLLRYLTDGTPDSTFGMAGQVRSYLGNQNTAIQALALQPDGKIVAVGSVYGPYAWFGMVRYLPDGRLDSTFGTGGIVTSDTMGGAYAVALQADGKIVTAQRSGLNFGLARFLSNGLLDSTFDDDGLVTTTFSGVSAVPHGLVVQADGKIVAVGSPDDWNPVGPSLCASCVLEMARYNANGSLDSSFGTGGLVQFSFSATESAGGNAVQLLADGSLLVAGVTTVQVGNSSPISGFLLARFLANGSLDPAYGAGGRGHGGLVTSGTAAKNLAIQADGKLVTVGPNVSLCTNIVCRGDGFAVARYTITGTLDSSFGTGGRVVTPVGYAPEARAVIMQSDSKIVVAGTYSLYGGPVLLVRYLANGSLDSSFGTGGIVSNDFGNTSPYYEANALALQADGKIIVTGGNMQNGIFVARFLANGSVDTSFGTQGQVLINGVATAYAVLIQPDGKIVVGGGAHGNPCQACARVVRLLSTGALDSGFGSGGVVATSFNAPSDLSIRGLALQADGKIVAGAGFIEPDPVYYPAPGVGVARYLADGTPDSSFGSGGVVLTNLGSAQDQVGGVVLQADGKIVLAGSSAVNGTPQFALARYTTAGVLDTTFTGGGIARTELAPGGSAAYAIQRDASGRLVVAGQINPGGSTTAMVVARYQTSGAPDPTHTPTASPTSTRTPTVTRTATVTATATTTAGACAISFSDVPVGSTYYANVECLACRGIVGGYSDGTYRPSSYVTRGQMAKFIANAAGYTDAIPPTRQTFTDVPASNSFWVYIERAAAHGVVGGYSDGSYKPGNSVTRGQMAKFVGLAAGYSDAIPANRQTFPDVAPGSTFWVYVEQVAAHGVVGGYSDGTYRPTNRVTRGQTAKFIGNAFFPSCATAGK